MSKKSKTSGDKKRKRKLHQLKKKKEESIMLGNKTATASDQEKSEILKMFAEMERKEEAHRKRFGNVKRQIFADIQGYRFVAVGDKVFYKKTWRTFYDFLVDYLHTTLTPEWGTEEIKRPEEEKHPIIKMYQKYCLFQRKNPKGKDGLYRFRHTGLTAAYFQLAYDLYVLDHHTALQEEVVRRLKNRYNYQGARYELTIAATFVRAGFDIQYEDETDRTKKHPEFVAVHKATGEKVSVEAKSRHRAGILDQPGDTADESHMEAGINRILNSALSKPTDLPYIICIDLNMPPVEGDIFESELVKELARTIDNKESNWQESEGFPVTMYIFTNYPHHYVDSDSPDPPKMWIATYARNPRNPFQFLQIVNDITNALSLYRSIPNDFEK